VLRYYVPVLFVAVIVQILLAGEGIFGIKGGAELDDQKTLLSFILTEPAALLLLICALLAWLPDRRLRRVAIALPFLIPPGAAVVGRSLERDVPSLECLPDPRRARLVLPAAVEPTCGGDRADGPCGGLTRPRERRRI
jgi:hypothetical protein